MVVKNIVSKTAMFSSKFHISHQWRHWRFCIFPFNFSISLALCNEDANGNVALGKSCNRYWQCQGGYPRLQRCPAMLVFDRRSLRCVVPPTEDCDVPTTQLPPEDLQENGPLPGQRGNDNGGLHDHHQRQFEESENDGIVPHLLLNTFSHRNP